MKLASGRDNQTAVITVAAIKTDNNNKQQRVKKMTKTAIATKQTLLTTSIQREWKTFQTKGQEMVRSAIKLGESLTKQKAKMKHGTFTAWLEENVSDMTPRHARRFMAVAAEKKKVLSAKPTTMKEAMEVIAPKPAPKVKPAVKTGGVVAEVINDVKTLGQV